MIKEFKFSISLFLLLFISVNLNGIEISRVEPPSWWIGMENPHLQILIYGKNLKDTKVKTKEKGIKILSFENADSPDYIFVNIAISSRLKPGVYELTLLNGDLTQTINYEFSKKENSGKFTGKGFGPEDLIYLLMPDRFINADLSNDNHPEAKELANHLHPYGRHGGDLKGMIESLDYLSELGVTSIWSTPLLFDNESDASYHGYACADYYRIDPRFGDNNLFREYVNQAADRGIGIIMDMVPNHSGLEHWWINNLPFKDWINQFPVYTQSNYAMSTHSDIHAAIVDNKRCTTGWFDKAMPDMNLNNPYLLTYFIQNAIWWTEWAGLSGIRVDTYPYSDKYAISKWTKAIMNEYPEMNIVGECWFSTPQEIAYWEGDSNNRDGYSSNLSNVMDFSLQEAFGRALNSDGQSGWGEGMFQIYKSLSLDFIYSNPYKLLIFSDNHDTNRFSEVVKGDQKKFKMMLTMLATLRGIPQLYYGTEIMMKTKDAKLGHGEERMDMIKRENFSANQEQIYNYTSELFNWRKKSKAITSGDMKHYWPYDNFYIYFRTHGRDKIMVVINNNNKPIEIDWNRISESIKSGEEGIELFSKNRVISGNKLTVDPQSSIIIEFMN
ncbi:MAG: alpha-amylase family glycosyl hydrolase [Bacteroidales bacterium]